MNKYQCKFCSYIYDPKKGQPATGVKSNTAFEDIPDNWRCPVCGAIKKHFEKIN